MRWGARWSFPLTGFFFFFKFLLIDFLDRGRKRERETLICSTYLCIHGLLLLCALTGVQTCNLGVSERCFNQRSYLARAYHHLVSEISFSFLLSIIIYPLYTLSPPPTPSHRYHHTEVSLPVPGHRPTLQFLTTGHLVPWPRPGPLPHFLTLPSPSEKSGLLPQGRPSCLQILER